MPVVCVNYLRHIRNKNNDCFKLNKLGYTECSKVTFPPLDDFLICKLVRVGL